MKLDNIFEHEFAKIKLKKVRLNSDPAKPILPYEGYILGEHEKFDNVYEGLFDAIKTVANTVGTGYKKLQTAADTLDKLGKGDLSVLASQNPAFQKQISETEIRKVAQRLVQSLSKKYKKIDDAYALESTLVQSINKHIKQSSTIRYDYIKRVVSKIVDDLSKTNVPISDAARMSAALNAMIIKAASGQLQSAAVSKPVARKTVTKKLPAQP
jgi:hypothetical protein